MATISKNARVCETCGSPIEATSAGDLGCIACLIATGLDAAAEQSDTTFASAPDQLGAYTIEHHADGSAWELGRGAMGVTYRAIDKALDRPVALKIINTERASRSAEARERFMREARAAAALRHPNVATVYQFGVREETGQFFYAMELVEGETLEERVRRLGPLDVLTTIDIALQVTAALEAAEERGLVHRDLKPGNLMLVEAARSPLSSSKDNATKASHLPRKSATEASRLQVKVIDFGVAKAVADKTSPMAFTHGGFVGTPAFASPEQFTNALVDVRSDIYSLGATLWFLLTGQMLFSGRTIEEMQEGRRSKPLPTAQLKAARVPHRFISLLTSMLAIEPAARPAGARELSARLQALRASITGRAKTVAWVTLAAAIVALATIVAVREFHSTRTTLSAIPEKSVAVLPFENLSRDPDNAYFGEGIQDEILTRLARIAGLKVISRTSTQRYQGKPRNLAEIANQLGVANILEGSVQKADDHVRVNVQLINAQSDSHLWAETYDRKLTDILGVESDVAKEIADALQVNLTHREEQALAAKPTSNPEAYDSYLRGLAFAARSEHSATPAMALLQQAAVFYERAVKLDPQFAIAWARLSRADGLLYFNEGSATMRDGAKHALDNAQKLEPNSPETLLALGYYQYHVLRDHGSAESTLDRVRKLLPGSSDVLLALSRVARREGHWNQSIVYQDQALALDPRNVELLMNAAWGYAMLRGFTTALKLYDRALDITPNDPDVTASKATIYQAQGNVQEAARLLAEINEQTPSDEALRIKITQLRIERNYSEAVRLLQARQVPSGYDKAWNQVVLALTQYLAGDTRGARITAEQARNALEPRYRDEPDYHLAGALSRIYAVLGEKDAALKVAEHAVTLLPRAKDAVWGPSLEENLAFIETVFGENSRAIAILTSLLQTPYSSARYNPACITAALLRLDPLWDNLRGEPAFQKLCEEKIDKSIAVLPLENLSRDPDNAYFAEGIQEEILTRLAKIAGLKVISRDSTQRYQGKPRNLGEIANQLGVANVLEGSVQKAADQVRVNVQLINAQTDSHLWAESYDRKLTDILGVESEIAKEIADTLQVNLTRPEQQALTVKPTNNPEAYDFYLHGLAFDARSRSAAMFPNFQLVQEAIGSYERAVQLDPKFAIAWARLSRAEAVLCFNNIDTTPATRCNAAKVALENAQELQPDSAETLLASGYYQYWVLHDYGLAKRTFAGAGKVLPSSSEVPMALGRVTRREGHWDQSIGYYEQALTLDPRDWSLLMDAAWTYTMVRQFPVALKLYDRVLDMTPKDLDVMASKAGIYQAQGNLPEAAKLLSEVNSQTSSEDTIRVKITQLRLERNYGEAIRLLQARQAQFHFGVEYEKIQEHVHLALLHYLAGDAAEAKVTAEQARETLVRLYGDQPDDEFNVELLSETYAAMGEKESALKQAERAKFALDPGPKDAISKPRSEENLALIQTMVGKNSQAISTLAQLLQTPYNSWIYIPAPITPAFLRLDPLWDNLRGDPAFQKLCQEKQDQTTNGH